MFPVFVRCVLVIALASMLSVLKMEREKKK